MTDRSIRYVPLDEVREHPQNPKAHDEEVLDESIGVHGFIEPGQIDDRTGTLIGGHGRLHALQALHAAGGPAPDGVRVLPDGRWAMPLVGGWSSRDDEHALRALIVLNRATEAGGWNREPLLEILGALPDLIGTGFRSLDDLPPLPTIEGLPGGGGRGVGAGSLADRFLIPPFSVLDARQGWWQDRKRAWIGLGIRSELGRGEAVTWGESEQITEAGLNYYRNRKRGAGPHPGGGGGAWLGRTDDGLQAFDPAYDPKQARSYKGQESLDALKGQKVHKVHKAESIRVPDTDSVAGEAIRSVGSGTSIFDPVLCELVYRWFCPPGGLVLDPFAGGSVRGIVAARLGRGYVGVELSGAQVEANRAQADDICAAPTDEPAPPWARGLSVAALRQIVDLYRQHRAGLVLGAYTGTNDRDVAGWVTGGELRVWGDGTLPVAVCWASVAGRRLPVNDWTGRRIAQLPEGTLQLRHLGCASDRSDDLAAAVAGLVEGHVGPVWAEVWQEQPVEVAAVTQAGLAYVGSKVRASSEIVGLYARGVDVEAGYREDGLGLCQLDLTVYPGQLRDQVDAAALRFADHYASYNQRGSWSAVALRGYGAADVILKPSEMSKQWKAEHPDAGGWVVDDTALRAALPAVEPILAAIGGGVLHRVRLMRLAAGDGELSRHADITDPDAGTRDGKLLRLHVPVVTNDDVEFVQWRPDGTRQVVTMRVGEVWSLDTRLPHTATNRGQTDRVHLVIDVEATEDLRARLTAPAPGEEVAALQLGRVDVPGLWPWPAPVAAVERPVWVVGDSRSAQPDVEADLVFSCPPYADLEEYSDDPADLSTLTYPEFREAHAEIIGQAVKRLRPDRYAVWVIGEARGPDGNYYGLVPDTIRAFVDAGCSLYNEAILVTAVGSLPVRAGRQFAAGRKLGKTHQNVLVFVKGDGRAAADACGPVEVVVGDPTAEEDLATGLDTGGLDV